MSSRDDVRRAVDSAVETVLARLRSDLVDKVVSGIPEPPPAPAAPAAASPGVDLRALRNESFQLLDGSGQVEILNRLMDSIGTWWDRAVLFLVKGTAFQPWEARGFDAGVGNAGVKNVVVQEGSDTLLDAALSGAGAQSGNHLLEKGLGPHRGARAAVPLAIRNKAAAILYVDGPRHDDASSIAALEILARVGASAIELGMLSKRTPPFVRSEATMAPAAGAAAPRPAMPVAAFEVEPEVEPEVEIEMDEPAAPAATFTPPPAPQAPTFTPPPEPPAPTFTPPPSPPTPTFTSPPAPPTPTFTPPPPPPTFSMPAPAAPAAASPAAPAAAPAAPAAAPAAPAAAEPADSGTMDPRELLKGGAKPVVDAGQSMAAPSTFSRWKPVRDQVKSGEEVDPALAGVPEAERPKHAEARKIARLLISEIKLYNEAKVAVGRKNKDLYERLKDDIEKSRMTYNDRVDKAVAAKTNYFRDELVASLGEGDASSLGPGLK